MSYEEEKIRMAHEWAALYLSGMTVEEVALEVNTTTQAVRKWLHRIETPMRQPGERPGVDRRPGARIPANESAKRALDPQARIVRPSTSKWLR